MKKADENKAISAVRNADCDSARFSGKNQFPPDGDLRRKAPTSNSRSPFLKTP
jgi:hypothetical protein